MYNYINAIIILCFHKIFFKKHTDLYCRRNNNTSSSFFQGINLQASEADLVFAGESQHIQAENPGQ